MSVGDPSPGSPSWIFPGQTWNDGITTSTGTTNVRYFQDLNDAMLRAMTKTSPPTSVLLSSVDRDGISPWDCCLICGEKFGEAPAEIFQVSDHANHARHGMHTRCVMAMIDKESKDVASEDQFDRYLQKVERKQKRAS